jgi:hypothetical protein
MMPVKVLFTVKQKDRNDTSGMLEFERLVPEIKKSMTNLLGDGPYAIETSFDQASVLYPKRFMFDYTAQDHRIHRPREVVDAFFDAVDATGVCLSKHDVHITIEWA